MEKIYESRDLPLSERLDAWYEATSQTLTPNKFSVDHPAGFRASMPHAGPRAPHRPSRARTGGQKPKLGPRQVQLAREMYDAGDCTVQQIAEELGVTRPPSTATSARPPQHDQPLTFNPGRISA
jgi:hypothetical protein